MTPLLLLHGALGCSSTMQALAHSLSAHIPCRLIDFPCHGSNTQSLQEHSIQAYAEYLITHIIDHYPGQKLNVFGYSMGGYVALYAALQRPELFGRIITLASKMHWSTAYYEDQEKMLEPDLLENKVPHYAQYLDKLHTACHWKDLMYHTRQLMAQLGSCPLLNQHTMKQIQVPVCMGVGDRDQMVSIAETEEYYRYLRQGSMYVLPSTIHPVEKVNHALLVPIILEFAMKG